MKIFNKIVMSSIQTCNTNDIWFDGKAFRIYMEGEETNCYNI